MPKVRSGVPAQRDSLIVVPLDGSTTAEGAIRFAVSIAQRAGAHARIEIVHVHDEGVLAANAPMTDSAWEDGRSVEMGAAVGAIAERLTREAGIKVTAVTLRGPVVPSLTQHAADGSADLIVMTTHARSGFSRAWLGSVAEGVIHAATTPVLVVRASEHARKEMAEPLFRRILLPIDREASGVDAIQRARTLGSSAGATFTLLTVVPPRPMLPPPNPAGGPLVDEGDVARRSSGAKALLDRLAATTRAAGVTVDIRVVTHDQAAPAILEVALECGAELVVLPTHPRTAFSRAVFGSVVDEVLRGAAVPLLLFRAA